MLRLARRGRRLRPFCQALGIAHRDYSRRLQRAMTDFGAEESFQRAAQRLQEHYGITVSSEAIRQQSLHHGKAMAAIEPAPALAAETIVTQMDGSLIPVVQPAQSGDKRKGKTVAWREVRVLRPSRGQSQPLLRRHLGNFGKLFLALGADGPLCGSCGPDPRPRSR